MDLQAVVVDGRGSIIDAVYYNNMKALRCMTHSGDEQTGDRAGLDEVIWMTLSKMPDHVKMLVFVIAAHTGGNLRDVRNGMIHVLEERQDNEVARFAMEQSQAQVDVVATIVRSDGGSWTLNVIEEPAQGGQHFIDVLEPTIGNLIRRAIPGAPKRQKVAFAMEKGAVFDLPATQQMSALTAGLGWDVLGQGVDLDVSAVLFDGGGAVADTVFFGKLASSGLRHSGDNLTGAGDGDDEQIQCSLDQIPAHVSQVFFVVNIYTKGVTFQKVVNAYCRIVDTSGVELARYELKEGGRESGLIIARLFREAAGRWGFQALGSFSRGTMWKDAVPDMAAIFHKAPRELQLRGASTLSLDGAVSGAPGTVSLSVDVAPSTRPSRPHGAKGIEGIASGDDPCCALQ